LFGTQIPRHYRAPFNRATLSDLRKHIQDEDFSILRNRFVLMVDGNTEVALGSLDTGISGILSGHNGREAHAKAET